MSTDLAEEIQTLENEIIPLFQANPETNSSCSDPLLRLFYLRPQKKYTSNFGGFKNLQKEEELRSILTRFIIGGEYYGSFNKGVRIGNNVLPPYLLQRRKCALDLQFPVEYPSDTIGESHTSIQITSQHYNNYFHIGKQSKLTTGILIGIHTTFCSFFGRFLGVCLLAIHYCHDSFFRDIPLYLSFLRWFLLTIYRIATYTIQRIRSWRKRLTVK